VFAWIVVLLAFAIWISIFIPDAVYHKLPAKLRSYFVTETSSSFLSPLLGSEQVLQ
jgi:hypothetical protein